MESFTKNLRHRVDELGMSLAEAARRCGLSERRLANYAAGSREPDLATLVRIAATLNISLDALLCTKAEVTAEADERALLRQQLAADAQPLDITTLRLVVGLVRTVVEHQRAAVPGNRRK
jgi:transcriptional regulator with XRE-family HTH domain